MHMIPVEHFCGYTHFVQQCGSADKISIPELERYIGLVQQIKDKTKERKNLLAEKKETPFYQLPKGNNGSIRANIIT